MFRNCFLSSERKDKSGMNCYSSSVIDLKRSICQPTWVGTQPVECYVGEGQVDRVGAKEPPVKTLGNHAERKRM